MIDEKLVNRILSTMTNNRRKIKMATGEECVELAQTILKSERLGEGYRNRKTNKTFFEELVVETADVFVSLIGMCELYQIREQVIGRIKEVCERYEDNV